MIINEGFKPKRAKNDRLPPGQYETADFPVLSKGPTPEISTTEWSFEMAGKPRDLVSRPMVFDWQTFGQLPMIDVQNDIHCVTKWSKFDTKWHGVSLDTLIELAGVDQGRATHIVAHSYDDYTTNVPMVDIVGGKAMIAVSYDGMPIPAIHGGPARLLIPHLYFWKSAKWVKKIVFMDHDEPGFWETRGYSNTGDPWKEERYS